MTVIVGFTFDGTATLVGDVLASADIAQSAYVTIPTVEDPEQTLWRRLGYSPGLVQKLAFVSPYLCVAWAGSLEGASRVLQEMEYVAGKGPVPKESFLEYMDTIPNDSQTGSPSFIILVVYEGGEVELLARNAPEIRGLPSGMRAFSAGTGGSEASDLLRNRGALKETGSSEEIALGLAQKIAGTFHGRESAPGPNASQLNPLRVDNRYGAGFEVAMLRDGEILPEAETTMIFWTAQLFLTGNLLLLAPKLFIRRDFQDGKLVLRSMRLQDSWRIFSSSQRGKQSCINIPRADDIAAVTPEIVSATAEQNWPPFNTKRESHIIRLSVEDGPTVHITANRSIINSRDRMLNFFEFIDRTFVVMNPLPYVVLLADLRHQFHKKDVRKMAADLERKRRSP